MSQSVLLPSNNVCQRELKRHKNSALSRLFQIILVKRECYINDLWEIIGYETVSTRSDARNELQRAIEWLLKRLIALNVVSFCEHMGMQILSDSLRVIQMPKVIIGALTHSAEMPTILVYGNLDVEEATLEEGWMADPFVLVEEGNYLYGRGVALDKGPLMCWLNAVQAFHDLGLRLPINIIFLIESMAHCGSLGLQDVLKQRISFFREVSCVVMATGRWQNNVNPCIICGSRGLVYYQLEVQCANRPLSSCENCGTLYEALPDLFYLLSSLVDCQMHILFDEGLDAFPIDRNIFRLTEFNYHEFGQSLDVQDLPHQAKKQAALAQNWTMNHLSIHGIEGASANSEIQFIIPNKVIGKFSISLAPHQNSDQITNALQQYLATVWLKRGTPNQMKLCEMQVIPPWSGNSDSPEYQAASKAIINTYEMSPSIIRDGGSMLAPSLFQEHLQKNVLVLPISQNDSGGSPTNERLSVDNFIMGTQLMTAFIWQYAQSSNQIKEKLY